MTAAGGPHRVGQYEILEEIARGGMGVVFRGRQPSLGREVAIKMLLPTFAGDPELNARFQIEAGAIALLAHENIVRIHDVLFDSGTWYIIMELIAGPSLRQVMDGAGPLEPGRAADLARQTANALAVAHARGIVHRDIKPGNLLLTASGVLKVMDFGIAKMASSKLRTVTGTVLGTPAYMSPEQAGGEPVDARADLYAVAVLLFELVTGRLPFVGGGAVAIAMQHLAAPPPDPRSLRPDLPEGLARVINKGLAKGRQDRYQSCAEMVAALSPFADAARRSHGAAAAGVCPTCGAGARTDFASCPSCGASLEAVCEGCGLEYSAVLRRCPFCWRRGATAPITPVSRPCRGCSAALRPDFLRCPYCGLEVALSEEPS